MIPGFLLKTQNVLDFSFGIVGGLRETGTGGGENYEGENRQEKKVDKGMAHGKPPLGSNRSAPVSHEESIGRKFQSALIASEHTAAERSRRVTSS
jgi:hypothetical protein